MSRGDRIRGRDWSVTNQCALVTISIQLGKTTCLWVYPECTTLFLSYNYNSLAISTVSRSPQQMIFLCNGRYTIKPLELVQILKSDTSVRSPSDHEQELTSVELAVFGVFFPPHVSKCQLHSDCAAECSPFSPSPESCGTSEAETGMDRQKD